MFSRRLLTALVLTTAAAEQARADDPADKVEALAEQLTHPNFRVRQQAAVRLGAMGPDAKAAVPALVRRVGDSRTGLMGLDVTPVDTSRLAALIALKKIAPDKVEEALEGAAKSKLLLVRAWAVNTLKRLKNPPPPGTPPAEPKRFREPGKLKTGG